MQREGDVEETQKGDLSAGLQYEVSEFTSMACISTHTGTRRNGEMELRAFFYVHTRSPV